MSARVWTLVWEVTGFSWDLPYLSNANARTNCVKVDLAMQPSNLPYTDFERIAREQIVGI